MTRPEATLDEIAPTGNTKELEALTLRRRQLLDVIRSAQEVERAAITKARAERTDITDPAGLELTALDSRLGKLLKSKKRYFWARSGRTITLPDAVITYRTYPRSLDVPRVTTNVVDFLCGMNGGNHYLNWAASLNKDAITNSNDKLLRKLRPFGVWAGRHEIIAIRSTGQDEPTMLDRRRFKERH